MGEKVGDATRCAEFGVDQFTGSSWEICDFYLSFLPRCIECRRGLAMRILSVRPFVRPSVRHTRAL